MTPPTPYIEATMNLASLNCSKLQAIVDDNKKALLANIHHAPISKCIFVFSFIASLDDIIAHVTISTSRAIETSAYVLAATRHSPKWSYDMIAYLEISQNIWIRLGLHVRSYPTCPGMCCTLVW